MALKNWNIDTVHSTVGFTVRHLMVSKVRGLFTKWEGTFAFDEENQAQGLPRLTMGIGLHLGPVVAGNIGSPERLKYGVVGPAVNMVSRIQTLTAGGDVLLSDDLLSRVSSFVTVTPGRVERVKGAREPVTVHCLLAVKDPA